MAGFLVRPEDVPDLARGCAALGSGGGGQVRGAQLLLTASLQERPVEVVPADELPPDASVAMVGAVGSPTVMLERLPGNDEFVGAARTWERHTGRTLDAVCVLEIGGINGLLALNTAARVGLPVLDADGMGRAFPRLDMTVLSGRVSAVPVALAESRGGRLVLDGLPADAVEDAVRRVLPAFGTWAAICFAGATVQDFVDHGVRGSVSRALALGRALRPTSSADAATAPDELTLGEPFTGSVIEVLRPRGQNSTGVVTLESHADATSTLRVDFLDEFLMASVNGCLVASAPDILCLLDERTHEPMLVDDLRVGQRLVLMTIPGPPEVVAQAERLGLPGYGLSAVTDVSA